jgi:hypothetical protein
MLQAQNRADYGLIAAPGTASTDARFTSADNAPHWGQNRAHSAATKRQEH